MLPDFSSALHSPLSALFLLLAGGSETRGALGKFQKSYRMAEQRPGHLKSLKERNSDYTELGLVLIDIGRFRYIGKGVGTETAENGQRPLFHRRVGPHSRI